jgi:hypothetical protein
MSDDLTKVSKQTSRVERYWINGAKVDLPIYQIDIQRLYFNIANGRYADRMIRLKREHPGVEIDTSKQEWKDKIEKMLAGEHRDTQRDKTAFQELMEDLNKREQLRPGVVLADGGVIDGNRRLAALSRLWRETNDKRFRYFDAAILPADTDKEDRWRIEAGMQLGKNDRWDYSPINELLKIRDGVQMYEEKIADGELTPEPNPFKLVARELYGKTEQDIREMTDRLALMDEYLDAQKAPGEYDRIGDSSEDFLEACKAVTAAKNRADLEPAQLAKLKYILFYVIHTDLMNNYDIRDIYKALGGDPKKPGKKPQANRQALQELLDSYPDPEEIEESLAEQPELEVPAKKQKAGKAAGASGKGDGDAKADKAKPKRGVDKAKAGAATERFKRRMDTKAKPLRTIAEGALADLESLEKGLGDPARVRAMTVNDRAALLEAIDKMDKTLTKCKAAVKKV